MGTGTAPSGTDAATTEVAAQDAPAYARRRGPSPNAVLAIAALGAAVAFVDATIVNIAFPSIAQSFPETPISSLSWVLNAYNIVFAAFLVASARIADLAGRRRIFVLGLELFTFASLLCALAPSADALIVFRVVQALGAAMVVPSSLALVLQAFPPERRAHGVALLSAVAAVAAGLGPSLGGLLVSVDDWRLVFLVNLPIGIAAVVLARRRLVESRAPGRRRMPDLLGSALFAFAVAALVLGVVKGSEWGWANARTIGSFALAIVLGAVVVWRCSWHRSPIIDLSLLRLRSFTAANAMTIVTAAGFYGYTLTNVLFLTGVWRYSVLDAGLALTPGPFVAAAIAGPTSRLVQRIGHRPVLAAGGLIWGGGVLWLVERVGPTPDFVGEWLPGIVLLGIGAGTLFPNLTSAAVAAVPGENFATATGLNSVARQVGAALGVAIVVAIIGTPSALQTARVFDDAWTFGAVCMFVAGLGCLFVGRIDVSKTPALRDSARVLADMRGGSIVPERPHARRAFTVAKPGGADVAGTGPRAESISDFLALVPLFAELEPSLRETISASVRDVRVAAGEWLFHTGEPGDALYVVRAGRLEVYDVAGGIKLRELGRGDAVGELGLLTNSPRSASVRASRTSDLLAIERDDFERLLNASPALPLALSRTLADLLRNTHAPAPATRPLPTTVAVLALDDRVALDDFVHGLAGVLGESSTILDGSESAPSGGGGAAVYGPVLDRAEAGHDLVLLAGGLLTRPTAWTEFCLAQADRILALSGGRPAGDMIHGRPDLHGCDLVACDVELGSGALRECVEKLAPVESHVFRGSQAGGDLERVARRLTGRSVGIVLSGGGARAFSHIGVLEELAAAGIVIDRVAGVSMGAFIGAMVAIGMDPDQIDARCFAEWVQRRPLGDYTLPRSSLIRGDRVKALLHRVFGSAAIEELPLSFMCGCAELRSGSLVLSRSGPLWESVAFSMAVPVLGPPQVRGRNLFVDGSLVDNLPVGAMAEMGEGPIIAVDVKATFGPPRPTRSGAAGADSDGSRPRERTPGIGETLTRLLLLASSNTSQAAERHAELIVKPRAEGVGLLEFHQLDAAREAGRAAARAALSQAPRTLFG